MLCCVDVARWPFDGLRAGEGGGGVDGGKFANKYGVAECVRVSQPRCKMNVLTQSVVGVRTIVYHLVHWMVLAGWWLVLVLRLDWRCVAGARAI